MPIHRDINGKWEHNHNGMFDCDTSNNNSKEAEYGGWQKYGSPPQPKGKGFRAELS